MGGDSQHVGRARWPLDCAPSRAGIANERMRFHRSEEEVMRRIISIVVVLVLALLFCSMSRAQEPAGNTTWDSCLKAPTRACILDEALVHALAIEPSEKAFDGTFVRTTQLGKIAQAQAAAGNVQAALRIAQLIPSDQGSRVTALGLIAAAQARLGMASEAKETFTQARHLADTLADQLSRAEVLHSLAQGEAEAGMAAEATNTFEESLKLAESVAVTPEVLASSPCVNSPAGAESRLGQSAPGSGATTGESREPLQCARRGAIQSCTSLPYAPGRCRQSPNSRRRAGRRTRPDRS
jgi:hypothetical protein